MNPHMSPKDLRNRDREVVERATPAMMLFLMMEACKTIGMEMRADVMHHLNQASIAPLSGLDTVSISRVAKQVDDVATTLLRDFSVDDPREGLYVAAMFTLMLVEEGKMRDQGNQAVLVSMMLLDDVRDEEPDDNGFRPVWTLNEKKWKDAAGKLMNRALIMGFYCGFMPLPGA